MVVRGTSIAARGEWRSLNRFEPRVYTRAPGDATDVLQTDNITVLFSAEEIATKVAEMGARIAADYERERLAPYVVCVLKGACLFCSDLVRAIPLHVTLDFIAVSSYGSSTTSSGEVRMNKDLDQSLEDRDVLIVEDIVDTGLTLAFLVDSFKRRGARSVRIAALLDKRARRKVDLVPDYVGFEIPDAFVVGYGLDFDERYRNLPFVGVPKDPSAL
jgi:hypoxanthine phosphoribosyltransferase